MSRLSSWGTTPHRARASLLRAGTGRPRISISPSSGIACAVSRRMVVDLPAPLGPSRPTQVPSGTSRSRWSTAVSSPKRLTTPCRRSASTPPRVACRYAQLGTGSRPNEGLEERHVRDQRLGVPLDADGEVLALDRLDRAVGRVGDDAQAAAELVDRLVVAGVDRQAPGAGDAVQARALLHLHLVRRRRRRVRLAMAL